MAKTLAAATVVAGQGIGHELDEDREGQRVFKAAAAVLLEDLVKEFILSDVGPQGQDGFGERQSRQYVSCEWGRRDILTGGKGHRKTSMLWAVRRLYENRRC